MREIDWSQLQSFVAVAKHGSLSAAARATQNSQPTMSRHIAQLETYLGARVFERSSSGVKLTDKGSLLLEHANAMADAAAKLSMTHTGATPDLSGTVRVTASQIVATYIMPPILAALRRNYPDICIELVSSDETTNLLWREADIAVRMYRPTQNDVIAQHVGDLALAAYATPDYVERCEVAFTPETLLDHDLVGYDRSTLIIDGFRALGIHATRDDFAFRSDDQVVCWQMVRAGLGVGFNQTAIGDQDPKVMRISDTYDVGAMPIWLTAHPELHSNPRVRRVYDHLRQGLREWARSGAN